MNLALQKRHEQLERWRQNEAQLIAKQQAEEAEKQQRQAASGEQCNDATDHSTAGAKKTKCFSPTIRRTNISFDSSSLLDDHNSNRISKTINSNNNISNNRATTTTKLLPSSDQQPKVKFTNSTLFLSACANGDLEECGRLLDNNLVDINTTTTDGLTGLHEAAICGNAELVDYLIDRGADIDCRDNEGWTPLHAAASLGQTKIVEILLKHQADATLINCENFLAYDLARNDECRELIGKQLEGQDIEYLRSQEERIIEQDIHYWIQSGQYSERSHPITGATVLHVLSAKGYKDLMKKILEARVLKSQINLEVKDNEGYTPLLAASFWNQSEIVELLIEHGANIFAQANNGYKISSFQVSSFTRPANNSEQQVMSRNPYLAASRPSSSYTRSSRSIGRPGITSGLILGRSRSSATLSSLASQLNSATGSTYASSSSYVPTSTWQRSASSSRPSSRYTSGEARANDEKFANTYRKSSDEADVSSDNNRSLCRSASSQYLKTSSDDRAAEGLDSSHLKNYQQNKLQQPTPVVASKNNRSSLQSLDSDLNSTSTNDAYSRRSITSLDSSDNEPIGDNIPSASAKHLRSQGQLLKSKSVELGSNQQAESPLLSSSMSVDRLLLRAESMGERDLRKSFKELVMENEKLKQQFKGIDEKEKQKQHEWIRKERELQRKISELEEENKQIEHWKQEIQRLKEENSSLIRVVSKLTKR